MIEHFEAKPKDAQMYLKGQKNLSCCPDCEKAFGYPVEWSEHDNKTWSVSLACNNCDHTYDGIFVANQLNIFEEQLDMQVNMICDDIDTLVQMRDTERFEAQIGHFVHALAHDYVLPEDIGPLS